MLIMLLIVFKNDYGSEPEKPDIKVNFSLHENAVKRSSVKYNQASQTPTPASV